MNQIFPPVCTLRTKTTLREVEILLFVAAGPQQFHPCGYRVRVRLLFQQFVLPIVGTTPGRQCTGFSNCAPLFVMRVNSRREALLIAQ